FQSRTRGVRSSTAPIPSNSPTQLSQTWQQSGGLLAAMDVMSFCRACACGTNSTRTSKSFCDWLKRWASDSTSAVRLGSGTLNWAVTSLLARSLQPGLGSVVVNAARSTVGGALLLGWVAATVGVGAFAAASTSALALLALSIVTAIAIGDTVCFESMHLLGVGRAMTIAMTYPVGATALAAAFLGEPITLPIVAGALLTLGGIV